MPTRRRGHDTLRTSHVLARVNISDYALHLLVRAFGLRRSSALRLKLFSLLLYSFAPSAAGGVNPRASGTWYGIGAYLCAFLIGLVLRRRHPS